MKAKRISVLGFILTGLTVITALAWLFPVYWIIATAFKSETDTVALPPSFVPLPPDFEAFTYVIQNSPVFRWYLISAMPRSSTGRGISESCLAFIFP